VKRQSSTMPRMSMSTDSVEPVYGPAWLYGFSYASWFERSGVSLVGCVEAVWWR
jgi:hypothetical protein